MRFSLNFLYHQSYSSLMKIQRSFWMILGILLTRVAWAYTPEEGKVTAAFGPYVYKTNFDRSTTGATSPVMGGMAIMALGDINAYGSLEIDMFFLNKLYIRDQDGSFISQQTDLVQVNMGYRYWFNPYFSASLSFYSSYTIGDPSTVHTDFPAGGSPPPPTSVSSVVLYGTDLSVQGELWSNEKVAVLLDGRYSKLLTGFSGEHGDHYGLIAAVRFLIEEKKKTESNQP